MIFSLYIIDSGMCIYNYNFKKTAAIDEQLLSGFLSAIGSFAEQTFQTGLQAIQIQNGQKMNFYIHKPSKLIFVAISDDRDNSFLLERILAEIAQKFTTIMGGILNSSERARVDKYREFDDPLLKIVKNKDKLRNRKTGVRGLFMGILIFLLTLLGFAPLFIQFGGNQTIVIALLIIYMSVGLSLSSITSGYYAGSPKMGVKNGIIFFILLLVLIGVFIPAIILIGLIVSPFALIVCAACGSYGGLLCDRRKLYTLEEEKILVYANALTKDK